jgi:hypothetical protein
MASVHPYDLVEAEEAGRQGERHTRANKDGKDNFNYMTTQLFHPLQLSIIETILLGSAAAPRRGGRRLNQGSP